MSDFYKTKHLSMYHIDFEITNSVSTENALNIYYNNEHCLIIEREKIVKTCKDFVKLKNVVKKKMYYLILDKINDTIEIYELKQFVNEYTKHQFYIKTKTIYLF